jgi:hypothetical protein
MNFADLWLRTRHLAENGESTFHYACDEKSEENFKKLTSGFFTHGRRFG